MKRFNIYPRKTQEDKIVYGDGIVEGIVLLAISEIPFAELCSYVSYVKNKSKAIKIDFTNNGVMVEVKVKIDYSQSVTDMAFKIQEAIRHNIESMTDYHVYSVNVIVNDVLFTEPDKLIAQQESSEAPTENAEKEKEEKKN
ncbi:MAG: Asp23/Gls24 family envelope stress response protein [Clostridia bacterium]|nr:Asp23/Gls24 family envelope stress response protein [Clostridia bacterium]